MKIILFLIAVILLAVFIAENKLILIFRRENLGGNIRILHISDIHSARKGKDNCRISDFAASEEPDMIFITGDLVSRTETDFSSVEVLLKNLCRVAPVYMVFGNHEQSLPDDYFSVLVDLLRKTGVNILSDDCADITINSRNLHIYGVLQKYSTYKKNDSYRNLDVFTIDDMKTALGDKADGETLLLAHNPLWADVYEKWGADYTFSGHIHGGVVRIFGKGLLSPERKFFPIYSKGVYVRNNMKLCVSAGVGKKRLFNPPEIVIYEI